VGAASLCQMRMKCARQCFGASVLLGRAASVGLSGCSHAAVLAYLAFRAVSYRAEMAPDDYTTWLGQLNATAVDPAHTEEEQQLFPRPRTRLGVSRYATRVAHIRPDGRARRETISVGSHRRLPSCFGDLARVRHQEEQAATAGVSQRDGQAAVPDDLESSTTGRTGRSSGSTPT